MEDLPLFRDLTFPFNSNLKVKDFKFIEIDKNIRIYYESLDKIKKVGFYFYVTNFACCDIVENYNCNYDNLTIRVICLFRGLALKDGLQHLYMGHEKDMGHEKPYTKGYIHRCSAEKLSIVFNYLHILEKMYCENN